MAVMQVNVPERKPGGFSQLLNMGAQGAQMYSAGSGIASLFGSAGGASAGSAGGAGLGVKPFVPVTEGMSPTLGGGAAAGSESGLTFSNMGIGMAAPMAVGIGGMAGGYKAEMDYNKYGSDTPNAKYSSRGKGPSTASTSAEAGKEFNKGIDAMSRRVSSAKMGNPEDILKGAKDALGSLKLDDPTKSLIGKKLDLGLSQLFKLKA